MSIEEETDKYWQKQIQLQKPKLAQLLNQRFSCETLFNLLASGEKCIYQSHKERKYRFYDPLKTAKYKNQEQLELEFRNEVRCFQACFIDDCEHGGFRYPDNLTKKEIIQDVEKWKEHAKKYKREILYNTYDKFLKLLEGEKIRVDKVILSSDNNSSSKGIFTGLNQKEAQNFINAGMIGSKAAFDLEDRIRKDYEKGDFSIKAKLYRDPPKEKGFWRNFGEKIGFFDKEDDFDYEDNL